MFQNYKNFNAGLVNMRKLFDIFKTVVAVLSVRFFFHMFLFTIIPPFKIFILTTRKLKLSRDWSGGHKQFNMLLNDI